MTRLGGPDPAMIKALTEKLNASGSLRECVDRAGTIVWGAAAIAPYLGRSVKGVFGALESGKVPGAKKIAGRWGLRLGTFYASFEKETS